MRDNQRSACAKNLNKIEFKIPQQQFIKNVTKLKVAVPQFAPTQNVGFELY
jgi:hypothetical protein